MNRAPVITETTLPTDPLEELEASFLSNDVAVAEIERNVPYFGRDDLNETRAGGKPTRKTGKRGCCD